MRLSYPVWFRLGRVRKAEPEKVRLDINAVISDAISLVHHEAVSNRVSLRLELASELPPVSGDRVQLQQVIINLAVNAIEAMAGIGNRPRDLLVRSYLEGSHQIVVAVQDRGPGIDAENIEKLFTPFFTTKRNGVGMGLSICRSIIKAHGGRVWATRNIGPGATFQFALSTKDPGGLGSPAN
jgi:signal transduction histidine kinase